MTAQRLGAALAAALTFGACGGSPTTATPPPSVTPSTFTISGQLTATNGGLPLTASMDFGVASTTAQNGAFAVAVPITAPTLTLTIAGSGLVTRRTYVTPGTRTVNLDAINESGFDLSFYRQLVRDQFDSPAAIKPLRRWTTTPRFYLRTVRDDGAPIAAETLQTVENVLRDALPRWTAGTYTVSTFERGTETRAGVSGWITITWPSIVRSDRVCGQADVAVSGGTIDLFVPTDAVCGCDGAAKVRPRTVRHELGHAMGFWHTSDPTNIMTIGSTTCDDPISQRELLHAAIAYKRPVGNLDPDTDPVGAVNLLPVRVY